MEQLGVVAGNCALSFSLIFLSIFGHISGSIRPITLIWASLERSFPPAEVEYRWCQFWSKVITSEVDVRSGEKGHGGYGRHRSQWVKEAVSLRVLNLMLLHQITWPTLPNYRWWLRMFKLSIIGQYHNHPAHCTILTFSTIIQYHKLSAHTYWIQTVTTLHD